MTKQQIIEYVKHTPHNTNPNVISAMIDSLSKIDGEYVSSFNSRVGNVIPEANDYTADMVGAPSIDQFTQAIQDAKNYTDSELSKLINGAPDTMDTLLELGKLIEGNQDLIDTLNQAIVGKLDASKLDEAIETALAVAKESGQFNGEQGKRGTQWFSGTAITGTDGVINVTVEGATTDDIYLNTDTGNIYMCTASSGTQWVYGGNIKGANGEDGQDGTKIFSGTQIDIAYRYHTEEVEGAKIGDYYLNTDTGTLFVADEYHDQWIEDIQLRPYVPEWHITNGIPDFEPSNDGDYCFSEKNGIIYKYQGDGWYEIFRAEGSQISVGSEVQYSSNDYKFVPTPSEMIGVKHHDIYIDQVNGHMFKANMENDEWELILTLFENRYFDADANTPQFDAIAGAFYFDSNAGILYKNATGRFGLFSDWSPVYEFKLKKGIDYWTETDKEEIISMLKDEIEDAAITITSVTESEEDGGNNIVTFNDGGTITIKNGSKGSKGDTPQKGTDYFTETDKNELIQAVLTELPKWEGGSY